MAVVRGAAEGEIGNRHCTQATNVNVGKRWMRLEVLHESDDAGQRHLTLIKRKWIGRQPRVAALRHS